MRAPGFTLTDDGAPNRSGTGDAAALALAGHVTLADGAELWRQLRRSIDRNTATQVDVDIAGVTYLDGGAAALLTAVAAERARAGGAVRFVNGTSDAVRLLDLYDCARGDDCERQVVKSTVLGDIGNFAYEATRSTQAILAFVGDLVIGLARAVRQPRTVHLGEFGSLVERAGTDALPIIVLINFLVGGILGLQGAIQLHRFGGDQFLANLVGLSVVRELGPLMTAILVTGRSGAAYAAELGTMTVNEEVDALRTLGQGPQRFLVFPRVLALLIVLPVLTIVGNLVGTAGGLAIAVSYLDQPSVVYLQSFERAVDVSDIATGLIKSVAFAVTIGLISCQRGLATRGGAAGVGQSTTSAVVVVLFALVALDAVFTWVFSLLGW